MTGPARSFTHLLSMSDDLGTFEHADHARPRRSHGYCTDDMARVLVAIMREPATPERAVQVLGRVALRFIGHAQGPTGKSRNRRRAGGRWVDDRGVGDCWGRSLWAFGAAARHGPVPWIRHEGRVLFERGAAQMSPWSRAMAFASLGAGDMLAADPTNRAARAVLRHAVDVIGPLGTDDRWPWPEERLTYANATIPEALIIAGTHLERTDVLAGGLRLLSWLLEHESTDGHYSPTPVGGSGPGDRGPGFDQQPIEAASMADACGRALALTGDDQWAAGIVAAARWFDGENDAGVAMFDPATGGGYDGLHARAANQNQGCESTLALITTRQWAATLAPITQ